MNHRQFKAQKYRQLSLIHIDKETQSAPGRGKVTKSEEAKGVPETDPDLGELEGVLHNSDSFVLKTYTKAKMVDLLRSCCRRNEQIVSLMEEEELAVARVLELEGEVSSAKDKCKLIQTKTEKSCETTREVLQIAHDSQVKTLHSTHDSQVKTLRFNYLQSMQERKDTHMQALQKEEQIHLAKMSTEKLTHIKELKELTTKLEAKCSKILVDSRAHYEGFAVKASLAHASETKSKDSFIRSLQAQLNFQLQQNKRFSESSNNMVHRNQEAMYQLMWRNTAGASHGPVPAPSITGALNPPINTEAPASAFQENQDRMLQLTDETSGNTELPEVFQPVE